MKKRIFGLAGLSILIIAGCAQFGVDVEESWPTDVAKSDVEVFASIEQPVSPDTKVFADTNLRVLWNANDTISFFNKMTLNEKWRFMGEEGESVGLFEQIGTIVGTGYDLDYYCAVYPYQSATMVSTDNLLTVSLPATQKYAANTFGPGANTMVAVSPTSTFTFKNVCGYLTFKLYGEGVSVSSITLKGNDNEPLAGIGAIPMMVDSLPVITMSDVATKEITLVCNPPVALGASAADYTEFWMVVPPTEFESGFTITIRDTDGMTIRKKLNSSLEIERSRIRRMAPLEVAMPEPEAVDLGLSVKWATFNVGANAPEEYGNYFAWGEVESKEDYRWETYKFELGTDYHGPFSKYVTIAAESTFDNKAILELEDDAAHVNWDGNWRIPTYAEWTELIENCTWTWTTENGVNGRLVTSNTNGNSIFLPAAGLMGGTELSNDGLGYYWSSLVAAGICGAFGIFFSSSSVSGLSTYRYPGLPVRPVYAPDHIVSVSLDRTSLTMIVGETTTLMATLTPSSVLIPSIMWSSSNSSIATVDYNGKVRATGPGSATITVTTTDGGETASCVITVSPPEAVDLGLPSGLKWAPINVGAITHRDFGDYFAWGETNTKSDYSWGTYIFEISGGNNGLFSKYVTDSSYGTIDNKTVLDLEDDAAHAIWGGDWRMPTSAEWIELINNCDWTQPHENGEFGMRVTSRTNGNSIYLPAAGGWEDTDLYSGSIGSYWSSTLHSSRSNSAWHLLFSSSAGISRYLRCRGQSIRPVYAPNQVETVSLDKSYMTITTGARSLLKATLTPSNVLIPSVTWSSSNNNVATVDQTGMVTAVGTGKATITVTTADGGKTASCAVTVAAQPEAVDLGLPSGLKWATFNVGASRPEEYGGYFAWGEVEQKKDYSWSSYKWCNGDFSTLTKYNTQSSYGIVDNKTTLDLEDDVAHVVLGGNWRMPTDAEWIELRNSCTWEWTTLNGVNGQRITSNMTGYTDKSIFLPAAGIGFKTGFYKVGTYGYYWSSSLNGSFNAWFIYFKSSDMDRGSDSRSDGVSVRPVCD